MGVIARLAYGAIFCVVLPALLVGLARSADRWVHLPVPWASAETARPGLAIAAAGAATLVAGMSTLIRRGQGLPMNAFPPKKLVVSGVYAILGQPIYVGAVALAAGLSIAAGSPGGLWLVTPILVLGAAALTFGHERLDLQRRFGARPSPIIGLPSGKEDSVPPLRRFGTFAFVIVPWLLVYAAVTSWPSAGDTVSAYFEQEHDWSILPWTEAVYASAYVAVVLAFLRPQSGANLRRLTLDGVVATWLVGLLWCTLPVVAAPRSLDGLNDPSFWVALMRYERVMDDPHGYGAFPSFHVVWTFLAAASLISPETPRASAILLWAWAVGVAASCVTTGMHAVIDVVAGFGAFLIVRQRHRVWRLVLRASESLANAWSEWHVGPIRIINHGVFGFAAALVGCLIVMAILGSGHWLDLWVIGITCVVTAALWAQIVEGESVSLRPFGYYGAVVGALVGGAILSLLGRDPMEPWSAFSVANPLIQAVGRGRCLIQGCCHGQRCAPGAGIVVRHPKSRVVRLAKLEGMPVYPTQTFSIIANLASALILYRLWSIEVPAPVLLGTYLLLAGAGRFVEEAYRGEPQTPRFGGLAIYQWNAAASAALGLCFLAWPGEPLEPATGLGWPGVFTALGFACVVGLAMGVDFPKSTRRFGRLT